MGTIPRLDGSSMSIKMSLLWRLLALCIIVQSLGVYAKQLNSNSDLIFDELIDADNKNVQPIDQKRSTVKTLKTVKGINDDLLDASELREDELQPIDYINNDDLETAIDGRHEDEENDSWLLKSVKSVRRNLSRLVSGSDRSRTKRAVKRQSSIKKTNKNRARAHRALPANRLKRQEDYDENYDSASGDDGFDENGDTDLASEVNYYRVMFIVREIWSDELRKKNSEEFMTLHRNLETGFRDLFNSMGNGDEEIDFRASLIDVARTSDPYKVHATVQLEIAGNMGEQFNNYIQKQLRVYLRIGDVGAELDDNYVFRHINADDDEPLSSYDTIYDVGSGSPSSTSSPVDPVDTDYDNNETTGTDTRPEYPTNVPSSEANGSDKKYDCKANPNGRYRCSDGFVINCYQVCDGSADCEDRGDERRCDETSSEANGSDNEVSSRKPIQNDCRANPSGRFWCSDGLSIECDRYCDGYSDCEDREDERGCEIPSSEANGSDNEGSSRKPIQNDCRANPSGRFWCSDGLSIECDRYCDGYSDCEDREDERGCEIPSSEANGSDNEVGSSKPIQNDCRANPSGRFWCSDGLVIECRRYCDGHYDCADREDERGCEIPSSETNGSDNQVVGRKPPQNDCKVNPSGRFWCSDGLVIECDRVCDGYSDCGDREDESQCADREPNRTNNQPDEKSDCRTNPGGELRCGSGEVVYCSSVCDGYNDCNDGSDELLPWCPRNRNDGSSRYDTTPSNNRDVSYTTPDPPRNNNQPDEKNDCRTNPGGDFHCGSGDVLYCSSVCDGYSDCNDGSDELLPWCPRNRNDGSSQYDTTPSSNRDVYYTTRDPYRNNNQPGEIYDCKVNPSGLFRCRDGVTFNCNLVCDGYADCSNGEDESAPACDRSQLNNRNQYDTTPEPYATTAWPYGRENEDPYRSNSRDNTTPEPYATTAWPYGRENEDRDGDSTTEYPSSGGGNILYNVDPQCRGDSTFRCSQSGTYICEEQLCDGYENCPDGEDELDCARDKASACTANEFICDNECYPLSAKCNGIVDCRDGYDERDCDKKCLLNEFQCRSGDCIPGNRRCDNNRDCPDGDDEDQSCPTECSSLEYKCRGRHQCISESLLCDGNYDCGEGDDEDDCDAIIPKLKYFCQEGKFTCRDMSCISIVGRCDGKVDCPNDRSDEEGCPCLYDKWQCDDGHCVDIALRCNGNIDCKEDISDERNCYGVDGDCMLNEFRCDNGQCILFRELCDNVYDCQDYSDEKDCYRTESPNVRNYTRYSVFSSTTSFPMRHNNDYYPSITYKAGTCKYNQFKCVETGVCIPIALRCDGFLHCNDISDELDCDNYVPAKVTTTTEGPKQQRSEECTKDEFACQNGACIPIEAVCDGIPDCSYNEDESNNTCSCRSWEFKCLHGGGCIPNYQLCDKTRQCKDGSDEDNCNHHHNNYNNSRLNGNCLSFQYQCADGMCILSYKRCNGITDCIDGSDEINCQDSHSYDYKDENYDTFDMDTTHCELYEFECDQAQCVPIEKQCDGYLDCDDETDELNCPPLAAYCSVNEFECGNTYCIPKDQRCNGAPQCDDSTDEYNCTYCQDGAFLCLNGQCTMNSKRCNGKSDCTDSSDELNCDHNYTKNTIGHCSLGHWECDDSSCINSEFLCDRHIDCLDGSDEAPRTCNKEAHETADDCSLDEFFCDDECHPISIHCDGKPDCIDQSDERNCRYNESSSGGGGGGGGYQYPCEELVCPGSGKCFKYSEKCDGTHDCEDSFDEQNCCAADQFTCRSGHCVPESAKCDGRSDCNDDSDEADCREPDQVPRSCGQAQFRCSDGQCITEYARCDGRTDCRDGSDEWGCPQTPPNPQLNLKTYPDSQIIKERYIMEGREVIFRCRDEGPLRAKVKWSRPGGRPLPSGFVDKNGRLEIPNIRVEDSGKYICEAVGYPPHIQGQSVSVHLTVEKYNPIADRPPTACHENQATCMNGECIDKHQICDGIPHCSDGSDEHSCSHNRKCHPNQYLCRNTKCINRIWRCDGENDCGDNSDEDSCDAEPSGTPCRYDEFQCRSGHCIPKSFHCDDTNDCNDGSDEIGCTAPAVIRPPPPRLVIAPGGVLNITCRAAGVPVPVIVWRLNWGHVPEKCESKTYGGLGTLYCPNMEVGDSGAYSCEIINSKGTLFVTPDTLVTVTDGSQRPGDPDVCPAGYFNKLAQRQDECLNCFCFGVSKSCKSAELYTYSLQPPITSNRIVGVEIRPYQDVSISEMPSQSVMTLHHGVQFRASDVRNSRLSPYLALPSDYLGPQLRSYGGFLKYEVMFQGQGRPNDSPDVIISGNGFTLVYRGRTQPQPNSSNKMSVPFTAGNWMKPDGRRATREEIMMILANVENILIRLSYIDSTEREVEMTNINMDSAGVNDRGLGSASLVEQCSCPPGYAGDSCERCAPEFERQPGGPWLGRCVPKEIIICPPGKFGDPRRGIPCQPCPCPLTNPTNNFASGCSLSSDGDVICNCNQGYRGRRCEYCDEGYEGDPLVANGHCYPRPENDCNPDGTLTARPDGTCECKSHVTGARCDECMASSFFLNSFTYSGCIECFCMGITKQCSSSSWYRSTISTNFGRTQVPHGFNLIMHYDSQEPIPVQFSQTNNQLSFGRLEQNEVLYWSLPADFLGDKVTAYGGNLNFTLSFTPPPNGQKSKNSSPDVVIKSANDITIHHYRKFPPKAIVPQTYAVPILESSWQRSDGIIINREHLLMALADIQAIYIKATYTTVTIDGYLTHVSLDVAEPTNHGTSRAYEVEECRCPVEYKGLSCEDCAPGYKRPYEAGLYLGLCEPCECSGHSNECDPETGVCLNCRDNTVGEFCNECAPGFVGNATNGSPRDCQPSGEDSGTCGQCNSAGTLSCDGGYCQCKRNVEGQNCDQCRRGTFGLTSTNPEGCSECFCSGASTQCYAGNFFKQLIPLPFIEKGPTITDENGDILDTGNQKFDLERNLFTYSTTSYTQKYWSLPNTVFGDRLKSYGGKLSFILQVQSYGNYETGKDVIIIGNGNKLIWTRQPETIEDEQIEVRLHEEDNWTRYDGARATRNDIMTVLSNLEFILIRATPKIPTQSSSIGSVVLESAGEVSTELNAQRVTDIEVCQCPPGYGGSSCQSCAPMYYRDTKDISASSFGSCVPCQCSEGAESCSLSERGYVECQCRPNYSGDRCQYSGSEPGPSVSTTTYRPYPYETEITVSITAPEISIIPVGGSVTLYCSGMFTVNRVPVIVTWYKLNGRLPYQAVQNQGQLYLRDLQIQDSGVYVCQATSGNKNFEDKVSVTISPRNQETAPVIDMSVPYISVEEYRPVELDCKVSGNPEPVVSWSRIGGYLSRDFRPNGNNLIISSVRKSDEGSYRCLASNSVGSAERIVNIYVNPGQQNTPPPPTSPPPTRDLIYIEPSQVQGVVGDTVRLSCQTRGQMSLIYDWTKDNAPVRWNRNIIVNGNVIVIRDTAVQDSGSYMCTGMDQRARRNYTSVAYVTIEERQTGGGGGVDVPGGVAPSVKQLQSEHVITQGQDLSITCEASGSPYPTIKWTKVHSSFESNIQQTGNVLRIINAQPANRGVFLCVAESQYGSDQAATTIDVEPRERPAIELYPPEPQTLSVGSNATLSCHYVAGIPTPKLTWRRVDGNPMPSRYREEYPGTGLITDAQFSDAGEYECTAENIVGKVTGVISILVQEPPKITLEPSEEYIEVTEGDELKIVCSATGSPSPSVVWLDDPNEALSSRPRIQPFAVNPQAVLEIYRVTMNDAKTYTCQASNDAGTDAKYVNVGVQRRRGDTGISEIDTPAPNRPAYRPQPQPPQSSNSVYEAELGESATLTCDITGNEPQLQARWERVDGSPLPRNSRLDRNNLIIMRVEPDAFGQYRCSGYDSRGIPVTFIVAELVLLPIPHITFHPKMPINVKPNDNVEIFCEVSGAQPINVVWYPDSNRPLPQSVQVDGQYLRFNAITPADAGRYYCSATNAYGNSTQVAEVLVNRGTAVDQPSSTRRYDINENEDVTLSCNIRSKYGEVIPPDTKVIWRRMDGQPLPRNSIPVDQRLYLRAVRPEDQGRYICQPYSSSIGLEPGFVDLVVKPAAPVPPPPQWPTTDNKIYENAPVLRLDQQYSVLGIGESTEVECYSSDNTYTEVIWERADGEPLPLNIKQVGNRLIISNADNVDAGVYVCKCKTDEGDLYTTSYKLDIAEHSKHKSKQPKIEYAEVGTNLKLTCGAENNPSSFRWSRQYVNLQSGKDIYNNELRLDNVQARDAGTYICTATQNGESTDYPTILVVTGAIPHFHQAPLSYMSFPALPSSSYKFNFDITFRPKQPNGLLLYNGQKKGSGDYIALSLNDRYPEFRFDFDGKPVTVRAEAPITLGEWHTIRVNRFRRDGYMTVDDQHPVGFPLLPNVSPLDLIEDLYIGAVPKWDDVRLGAVENRIGFVGCISRLTLQDQIIELYKDARHKEGITSCEPCADDPCQNDGICLESQTEMGYTCICQDGFTGKNCAVVGTSCTPGICGTGRCENTEMGMECYCALNKTGDRCQYIEHLNEASIAFRGNSFAAYSTPRPSKLNIKFSVRPDSLEDALLLYLAESKLVSGDFVAVVLHDKHVELRINTASRLKPVVVRSLNPLPLNKWTEIEISRRFGEGILRVGDEPEQKAKGSGLARTLHIKTPLYIGGYDHQITLNRDVNITRGFHGCVSNLVESNRKINLIAEIKDAANIQNCGEINEVEPPSGSGYEANELEDDPCRRDPCENGGTCVAEDGKAHCDCPLGLSGKNCEIHVEISYNAHFRGNGYLELERNIFGDQIEHETAFVAILFSTMEPNGLLLWWGQKKGEEYNNQDFMALAVVDGIVELSFRLDGEEKTIRSTFARVDDGKRHIVILKRDGNQASLELNHLVQVGESIPTGKSAMYLPGNVFIGGTPDLVKFTGNRYTSGFNGCVHVVEAEHSGQIQLSETAISAVNLDTCPDDDDLDGTEPPVV